MFNRFQWSRRSVAWAATAALATASGCARAPVTTAPAGWPRVLRYAVSISQENPETEGARLEPIRRYLSEKLQMPVEVWGASGYGVAIEAFRARKFEASTLGPFGYVIGSERTDIEAIATRGSMDGVPRQYSGTLAVAAGSPLRTIDDVRRNARKLSVSFVDPASTSGNLLQRAYLNSIGITPERDFRKVLYSLDHPTSAMTLLGGKVDVAAIGENALEGMILAGKVKSAQFHVIWKSAPIPETCVAVRKDLPVDFEMQLQQALLAMATEAPNAYRNMAAKVYFERYKNTRLVAATDATYEQVRRIARTAGQLEIREP